MLLRTESTREQSTAERQMICARIAHIIDVRYAFGNQAFIELEYRHIRLMYLGAYKGHKKIGKLHLI